MPVCIQCGQWYSSRYKLAESSIPLTRRKRCFICQPYQPRPTCDKCGGRHKTENCEKEYSKTHRTDVKKLLVEYKGGKCIHCGYNRCIRALCFHHIKEKKFAISQKAYNLNKMKEEVDKCVLLCHNCHMELHDGLWLLSNQQVKQGSIP